MTLDEINQHRRNMGLPEYERKSYSFAFEGVAYEAMLPEKFLYPLFIRLPDARVIMQRFVGALWKDITWADNRTLTTYDAREASEDTLPGSLIDQLQGAIIFTGLSAGAVYGLLVDGDKISYGGRVEIERARELLKGRKKVLTVDGDDNDITGLWLPDERYGK